MPLLEFAPERVPTYKLGLHAVQMVFTFIAWCLGIAIFTDEDASINGNNGWPFGLAFLSIPAWIYLTMAPRFPRTRRFAEPRVMAVVDGVYAVLWLSAFASQAAFNSAGDCGQSCNLSKTIVGLAFFVCLFFILSTILSIYTVKYWQWNNGRLPGYPEKDNKATRIAENDIDPDKGAFSTDMHDVDGQYAAVSHDDREEEHNTSYGGAGASYSTLGSRFGATDMEGYGGRSDLSYGGGGDGRTDLSYNDTNTEYEPPTAATSSVGGHPYNPPSAQSDYDDTRPVRFPSGNYAR